MALVKLGLIPPNTPDMASDTMRLKATPIPVGSQRPGDLAFYRGHVDVVATWPGRDGHSEVVGSQGGDKTTHGDKPTAKVKVNKGGPRGGMTFLGYGRLKIG